MRTIFELPAAMSFLRWIGGIGIVMTIVVGILGMHMTNGTQATPMTATIATGVVITTESAMLVQMAEPVTPSSGVTSQARAAVNPGVNPVISDRQGSLAVCGCVSSSCGSSLALHAACVPVLSPVLLNVPLPGILAQKRPVNRLIGMPRHKSEDRLPSPPSLTQLSINRT